MSEVVVPVTVTEAAALSAKLVAGVPTGSAWSTSYHEVAPTTTEVSPPEKLTTTLALIAAPLPKTPYHMFVIAGNVDWVARSVNALPL